jgi:hypothetical protein
MEIDTDLGAVLDLAGISSGDFSAVIQSLFEASPLECAPQTGELFPQD